MKIVIATLAAGMLVACGWSTLSDDASNPSSGPTSDAGATPSNDVILDAGACTAADEPYGPYCPWNDCYDGPRARCSADHQWHCPAPPAAKCCYRSNTSERIPCDASAPPATSGGATCAYAPVDNDPRCPPVYTRAIFGEACAPLGLSCAYPGQGDGEANGCYATAMMWCVGDAGVGGVGDAADGGAGTWTGAQ